MSGAWGSLELGQLHDSPPPGLPTFLLLSRVRQALVCEYSPEL